MIWMLSGNQSQIFSQIKINHSVTNVSVTAAHNTDLGIITLSHK
jgi:hypothetical protein